MTTLQGIDDMEMRPGSFIPCHVCKKKPIVYEVVDVPTKLELVYELNPIGDYVDSIWFKWPTKSGKRTRSAYGPVAKKLTSVREKATMSAYCEDCLPSQLKELLKKKKGA